MSLHNACLGYFADIQISHLDGAILGQEYVGTLDIPMNDLFLVQAVQPAYHLIEDVPDLSFLKGPICAFAHINLRLEVPIVAKLHHDA